MEPSYALMPATSYPKTVGGMCYAVIKAPTDRVKTSISDKPITGWERKHNASVDTLSQHAVAQS